MIHARKDAATGRLSEATYRPRTYVDDVALTTMPTGFGPWIHDTTTPDGWRVAVAADLTTDEKLDAIGLPKRLAALFVLASSSATPAQRARAQTVVDATAAAIVARWTS